MAIQTLAPARARPTVPVQIIVALLLLASGLIPVAALSTDAVAAEDTSARIVWSVVAMTFVAAGCLVLVRHRVAGNGGPAWAHIGPAFVVYFGFAFGVTSLAWLRPQQGSHSVVDPTGVPTAVLLSALALAVWTIGYWIGPPALVQRAAIRLLKHSFPGTRWKMRFRSVPLMLYGIASLARIQRIRQGRFAYLQDAAEAISSPSSLNQLLALTEGLALSALVLAALDASTLSRSLRSRVVLTVLSFMEVLVGLFAASKETVLLTLMSIGLVWVFTRGRIPRVGVALAILLVLVVFPYNSAYRDSIRQGVGSLEPGEVARTLPVSLSTTVGQLTPHALFVDSPAQISARVRQTDNIAIIDQRTPELIPYRPWTDLVVGITTGTIPRVFWPGKPVLSSGLDFSHDYYDLPTTAYSASAVTVPGDLLRHGGLVPLVIGMALVGMLVRTVDRACDPLSDPRHLLFFVPLFAMLIKSENDVVSLSVGFLQILAVLAFASRFAFVRRPA
jgi:hypothetical protein